uniref:PX domain-containing protein n=1 Tax=Fibrocapsa japonica TaxID=94617 RepID=A0A7S2Y112_9STRA|mmetsp:Transcript_7889/g.12042  ORF Transcript_7889/g.12042 Transcript_7889/m.12042 type:complete len:265 (+) Transcript_7889:212-1006(+)|eukprot:CAMPEP_0113936278 /NCGR_PEP_ID=MMETSP1339-20121228/3224_1 /TAXON_ID=94617 /ORGANISM="Fibrocapsa japonica" /LENGTH=264 /DNA_ID=CAMNT_0000938693 /DNA_START=194 /DNA_END=988 /DNA_ORIENTATION=- /assembly_acc=CAM_ASM_000762
MQTTADVRGYEKSDKGHVIYAIEVGFASHKWLVFRRFKEVCDLHHTITKEEGWQPPKDLEPPPKRFWGSLGLSAFRRFDPEFLAERAEQLGAYLARLVGALSLGESQALRTFLEVENHVDWDFSTANGFAGGSAEIREMAEQDRLALLVDETARALIDVSRSGVEAVEAADALLQRQRLLLATDGFRAQSAELHKFFQPTLPTPSTQTSGADAVVDTLNRAARVNAAVQQALLERVGMAVADRLRDSTATKLDEGHELVSHMQS